jgi:hypothetical protein
MVRRIYPRLVFRVDTSDPAGWHVLGRRHRHRAAAHCIDGQADAANKRIADALGGTGDSQDDQDS